MKIEFYQRTEENTNLTLTSTSIDGRHGINKMAGTALRKLFKIVDAQGHTKRSVFKLNKPVQVRLTRADKIVVDTTAHELLVEFSQSLKLNRTAKSKRRFAERFMSLIDLYNELQSDQVVDVNELVASLN